MPEELTIATFNWKNGFNNLNIEKSINNCKVLTSFIDKQKIDLLGLQESVKKNLRICYPILKDKSYTIYGDGRFGKYGKLFPFSILDETDSVISRLAMTKDVETIRLPWLGSQLPRIVNKISFGDVVFLNTHLTLLNNTVKKNQLELIYTIIKYEVEHGKKVILTGDFNMTQKNIYFSEFINKLDKIGIKRLPADKPTCKMINAGPLDHIFFPKEWEIREFDYVELGISDHLLVWVKVKTNK